MARMTDDEIRAVLDEPEDLDLSPAQVVDRALNPNHEHIRPTTIDESGENQ